MNRLVFLSLVIVALLLLVLWRGRGATYVTEVGNITSKVGVDVEDVKDLIAEGTQLNLWEKDVAPPAGTAYEHPKRRGSVYYHP